MYKRKQTVAQFEVSTQTSKVKPFVEPFLDKKPFIKKRLSTRAGQVSKRVNGIDPLGDSWRLTDTELLSQLEKIRDLGSSGISKQTNGNEPVGNKKPLTRGDLTSTRVNGEEPLGDSISVADSELLSRISKLTDLEWWRLPTETNGIEPISYKKPLTNMKSPTNKKRLNKKKPPTDAQPVSRQANGVELLGDKNRPANKEHPTSAELLSQLVNLQSEQTKSVGTIKSILKFFVILSLFGVWGVIFLGRLYYAFMP